MSDTRRDQLIDYIEKEFIGPDPIDWPGIGFLRLKILLRQIRNFYH